MHWGFSLSTGGRLGGEMNEMKSYRRKERTEMEVHTTLLF